MTLYKGSHSLFRVLAPEYRLNKAEFVQMYNLRPRTQVMLELIIEEVGTESLVNAVLLCVGAWVLGSCALDVVL